MIRLFINSTEYTDYIIDTPTFTAEFEDGKIIGNAPSVCFHLSLNNESRTFDTLLENEFVVCDYKTDQQLGIFFVVEKPEKITNELSLTLYDSMIDLNIAYDTDTTMYPTIISKQIEEIETILNKTIDTTDLGNIVLNYAAEWYDNTISIRDFICFIGELGGCNLFCTANGNYSFKKIKKISVHEVQDDDVETVDVIENFECTRIMFDNGVIVPLIHGDETGNTIYISKDNSYVKAQEQIDYLFSVLGGIKFKTIERLVCVEIDNLILGDISTFNGYNFIALKYTHELLSGEYGIQTIDGNLVIKNAELVTQHIDNTIKIHRLKTEFDQEKLKWSVTAEQTEGNASKIGRLEVDVSGVKGTVEEVKEVNGSLVEKTNNLELAVDGLENKLTSTGGNNLIKDSMGVYGDIWDGAYHVDSSLEVKNRNIYGFALLLDNSHLKQNITLPNGSYMLSFSYQKHVALANVRLLVNNQEFVLSNLEYTNFNYSFEVTSGSVELLFVSDTSNSCTLVNLMLNQGTEAMVWSLNSNESWTDTLKMSSAGLVIDATGSDVLFNAKADIIGFKNKNTGEYVAVFTDVGADMKELSVKNKASVVGLLFQEINGQTVINRMGGDR